MLGESESIAIPQSSNYAKEMRKWEAFPTKYGPPGRPFQHYEYPKMLYKCSWKAGEAIQPSDKFIVNTPDEEANMNSRGYLPIQQAYDAALKAQTEAGKLAAEREYQMQHGRMSPAAQAEIRAAEQHAGSVHLPDVTPDQVADALDRPKRRGRKAKVS